MRRSLLGAKPLILHVAVAIDDGYRRFTTPRSQRGTPVYSSDEVEVGKVDEVLDNFRERIFDGLVIEDSSGDLRFVDAPEVARTAERGVTLSIDAAAAAQLPAARAWSEGLTRRTRVPGASAGSSAAAGAASSRSAPRSSPARTRRARRRGS